MANSAEVTQLMTTSDVCKDILLAVKDCKTLEEIEKYVYDMMREAQRVLKARGLAVSPRLGENQ
jgi:hypothetical protein